MRKTVPPSPLAKLIITKNISKNKKILHVNATYPNHFWAAYHPCVIAVSLARLISGWKTP
jgi:hypothetical protein